MRKNPPFSAPGARASGHLARQFRRLGFSWVRYSFVSLILWVFWHFHFPLLFLSLRYGADLCRSRLVLLNFELRWSWEICPWKYSIFFFNFLLLLHEFCWVPTGWFRSFVLQNQTAIYFDHFTSNNFGVFRLNATSTLFITRIRIWSNLTSWWTPWILNY